MGQVLQFPGERPHDRWIPRRPGSGPGRRAPGNPGMVGTGGSI